MSYDPIEMHRKMSAAVQIGAERKLGRPLTSDEEYRIWNFGSFMGLEAIDRAVYNANSPEDVERYLAGLPKGDPLPAEYTRRL